MESPRNRDELMNSILSRSVSDREFRQSLLTDPKTAILKTFGIRVPEDFTLRFIEKPPDLAALIVLPDPAPSGELSDKELESVAGGAPEGYQWAPSTNPGAV